MNVVGDIVIPHAVDCKCKENPDDWSINAPEHHNCFWTYLKYNERPHTLAEVAHLLNLSISAVNSLEQKALKKLNKKENLQIFYK